MILRGIQRRLLKTLADVDDSSGEVSLEDKGDYYDVVGWKESQDGSPIYIGFKISAGEVKELVENRCVQRNDGDVFITAVGRELLKR